MKVMLRRRPSAKTHGAATRRTQAQTSPRPAFASLITPVYAVGNLFTQQPPSGSKLSPAQINRAINFHRSHYSYRATLLIQNYVGAGVDGKFGPESAKAVARFQHSKHIGVDGMVGKTTLDAFLKSLSTRGRAARNGRTELLHLVAEYYGIDIGTDTLSLRYDPNIGMSFSQLEAGGLRVVHIGPHAFTSIDVLHKAIAHEMHTPLPALIAASPTPQRLGHISARSSLQLNKKLLQDHRAIKTVQYLVGSSLNGFLDLDTVQRIAEFQHQETLAVNGLLDSGDTMPRMVGHLIQANFHNAALRLIVDFYNMNSSEVLDISYDKNLRGMGNYSFSSGGPILISIGRNAFRHGYASLVHTVAHYMARNEAVVQHGVTNANALRFIGEATEILSQGMRAEDVGNFYIDARRALHVWVRINDLSLYRWLWPKFKKVRKRVLLRLDPTTNSEAQIYLSQNPTQVSVFLRLRQDYHMVQRPF